MESDTQLPDIPYTPLQNEAFGSSAMGPLPREQACKTSAAERKARYRASISAEKKEDFKNRDREAKKRAREGQSVEKRQLANNKNREAMSSMCTI